jgi:DNA-binding response OmpR family regulator
MHDMHMRILIVEDEQKIAAGIRRALKQEKYAVDIEYGGEEGASAAAANPYDLIILDIMLPGKMNGVDVCREIRSEGLKIPILMLTAKDTVTDKVAGLDAGADDYLAKPFALEELLARVRALLRRPQDLHDEVFEVGNLALDTASLSVTREEKPISLTQKEYALFEYLLRNQGRIITKDQIIDHVWDYDANVLPNTVEVYVNYLRKKLGDRPDGRSVITTARGFGYTIEAE